MASNRSISMGSMSHAIDQNLLSGMMWDETPGRARKAPNGGPTIITPRYRTILFDDFLGASPDTTHRWNLQDTSAAGAPACTSVTDEVGGVASLHLAANSEAETFGLNFGDVLTLSLDQGLVMECGWTWDDAPAANEVSIIGFGSAHDDTLDDIVTNAWFRVDGDADILVETDDGSTDDDDNDTGENLTAGTFVHTRIEAVNEDDVRFWINGVRQLSGTTFACGANTVQPMAIIQKASGTTTPDLRLDYIVIASKDSN